MYSRRALLYVPGDDRHKIEKALTFGADCICLDMEDGVAPSRKTAAREEIARALGGLDFGGSERLLRLNPVGSGLEAQDLAAVLPGHPEGIVLPKVESPAQLQWAAGVIEAAELANGWPLNGIRLLAGIETPRAMLALGEIAAHPRLDALIFGGEDYAASVGAQRTPEAWELFTARSLVVMHAKAHDLQAIDMVTVEYHDVERVRTEALLGAQLGYTGKQIIHPAQVIPVQEAFTPGAEQIRAAQRLVQAFDTHQEQGKGAFGLEGRMIDLPLIKAARGVLERARAANKL